jgi:alpha-aminoadipate carrier protein LysW
MAHCPECEALVDLDTDELEEGEIVSCPECGTDLEVVSTNPVELRPAADEDMEDDEDEDDEDDLLSDEEDEEDYDE